MRDPIPPAANTERAPTPRVPVSSPRPHPLRRGGVLRVPRHCPPEAPGDTTRDASPPYLYLSDAELVALCLQSDERAWSELVTRHEGLVYSTALSRGLTEDDAIDVFQYVWLELHESLPRLRNPQGLVRWLMVAARRQAYKVVVERRRMVQGISRDQLDPAALPDGEVEAMQVRERLERALVTLGGSCERLLRLLFLSGRRIPYDRIARESGLAVGSIGPIRARCLARLRRLMEAMT